MPRSYNQEIVTADTLLYWREYTLNPHLRVGDTVRVPSFYIPAIPSVEAIQRAVVSDARSAYLEQASVAMAAQVDAQMLYQQLASTNTPAASPQQAHFHVYSQADIEFIYRVYNPYRAQLGERINHRFYTVTPETCTPAEADEIRALRLRAGITHDASAGIFDSAPIAAAPIRRGRTKLPREEIEPLPLPG